MLNLRGACTALVTPMTETGAVDYDGFRRLVRFQIEQGIHGLLPLGTTGETPTLERDEQDEIIRIAVVEAAGAVPVMVGVGANSTQHTVENAKRAAELGADALLVVTPYYNKPSSEGIYRHFSEVAQATDKPIIVYNIASRTGKNIDVPLMDRLSRIPTVCGVKEASGDINQMMDVIHQIALPRRAEGKQFLVFSGDDAFTLPLCALGGDGIISVVSNLLPAKVAALAEACLNGDFSQARALHYELLPVIRGAFIETNPVPIKTAMGWLGLPAGPCRLPLCEMEKKNEDSLRGILRDAGIIRS
jgi:4-hydroxy-tetrahydrodipicolinate synthase